MEPHYVRANTSQTFLGSELNIQKMHHLYVEECKSKDKPFVKEGVYRRVSCEEFRPRKDRCGKCQQSEDADDSEKSILNEEHERHLQQKELPKTEKNSDKEKAKAKNSTWYATTMDLQSVLSTRCGNVSSLYYASRKLSVYNFTIRSSHWRWILHGMGWESGSQGI